MNEGSQSSNKWSDLRTRSISAVVLGVVVLWALYAGGPWFQLLMAVMVVLMALEYVSITHGGDKRQFAAYAGAGLASVLMPAFGLVATPIGIVVLCGLWCGITTNKPYGQSNGWWRLSGTSYVALPALALVLLRADAEWGWNAVLWLVLVVWATDIGAYFAGRIIGGPKLAPRLSPKKTWAGLTGGMAAAAAISALVCVYLGLSWHGPTLIAPILAVIAQAGDIYESALKRHFNLKDASNLIPGHGGVLDRVDGLIAAAVAAAALGFLHNPGSVAKGLLLW